MQSEPSVESPTCLRVFNAIYQSGSEQSRIWIPDYKSSSQYRTKQYTISAEPYSSLQVKDFINNLLCILVNHGSRVELTPYTGILISKIKSNRNLVAKRCAFDCDNTP